MIKLKKRKRQGFTIVELIVVMAILAILTLIAIPTFAKFINQAEKTAEGANADTYYTAAYSALIDEVSNPTGTYNTPKFDSSNNGLEHNTELYVKIADILEIPNENMEVYTVKTGNQINDFNYENMDITTYSEQFVDEWSIIMPIKDAKNSTLDLYGDIYIIPPAFKSGRFVYKNGINTNILLSKYKV